MAVVDNHNPEEKSRTAKLLASEVAHELNNIIYPMLIYVDLLLNKLEVGTDEHSDAHELRNCVRRAEELVSQLSMISGRTGNNRTQFDLAPVVREGVTLIRKAMPATMTLDEPVYGEEMLVTANASQMLAMIANLYANAEHSTAGIGQIKITLDTMMLDGLQCVGDTRLSGPYVCLAVADDGPGIREEGLDNIFEPFSATNKSGIGKGLGLAAVLEIVRRHEGGISVSSQIGSGTTFAIYLPLAE
jgi:signal transduction histidine kinase